MRLLRGLAALLIGAGTLVGIMMMADSGPPANEIRVGYLNANTVDLDLVQAIVTTRGALPTNFGQASVVRAMVTADTRLVPSKEVSAFALTRAVIQYSGPSMANDYLAEERFVDLRRLGVRLVHVRPLRY
ncbi:MAG: hypothetical protein AAB759_02790 [Patescibacteria group bacterium]